MNVSDRSGTGPGGATPPASQQASRAVQETVEQVQQTVGQVRQAGEQVLQAGSQAAGQAKGVAQDAMARGSSLAGEARNRLESGVQEGKDDLAGRLEDAAHAVHRSGEQLEGHQDWLAGLVEKGADELGALANTVRTNDLRALMSSLEALALRQPALFVGAAMATGFALVRFGRVAASGASRADLPNVPPALSGGSHERE
jgi:hypothetical protein